MYESNIFTIVYMFTLNYMIALLTVVTIIIFFIQEELGSDDDLKGKDVKEMDVR